jgi:hypothetical protein
MREPPQPMTLGNMRENGVRALAVYCERCHHDAVIDVSDYADDVPVPAFGPRMVCTRAALSALTRGRTGTSAHQSVCLGLATHD